MKTILEQIIDTKHEEVAQRKVATPVEALKDRIAALPRPRNFFQAVTQPGKKPVNLIAEVKKASPSAGVIRADFDPVAIAKIYEANGADALSVLTDEKYFRGSLDDLVTVRGTVSAPLLRKEFIVDEYQLWESRAAGADAVLLIVAALDPARLRDLMQAAVAIGLATLVEVHDSAELDVALRAHAPVIGVNNRDLRTLRTSLDPSLALLPLIPPGHVAVSESGIASGADVERVLAAGAHAILVGEGLVRAPDVSAKVRELLLA